MTEQDIPESRTYRHIQCGNVTNVEGQSFEIVSNPMSSMERTLCASCGKMFPITDFEWVETKETIADYYARHSATATNMQPGPTTQASPYPTPTFITAGTRNQSWSEPVDR